MSTAITDGDLKNKFMRPFKSAWSRLSLQTKLQLGIQPILLAVLIVLQHFVLKQYEHYVFHGAQNEALVSADGVLNGLNMLMLNGIISDPVQRKLFIQKMGDSEGVVELRVIRNKPVQDQFGMGLPQEQAVDELDQKALSSGQIQARLFEMNGNHLLRVVQPFIAKKEFRGTNCLSCHTVPEGTVNGATSITLNLDEEYQEISRANNFLWTLEIVVQIILY